jgi:hypothetical protein
MDVSQEVKKFYHNSMFIILFMKNWLYFIFGHYHKHAYMHMLLKSNPLKYGNTSVIWIV